MTQIYGQLNTYHIVMEVAPAYQTDMDALSRIYVTNSSGQLVPVSQFAQLIPRTAAVSVNHQGQFPAVILSLNLAPGTSLGTAVDQINQATAEIGLPKTVEISFQGTAQAFHQSLTTEPLLIAAAIFGARSQLRICTWSG